MSETLLTVEVHIIFVISVAVFILAYQGTHFDIVLSGNKYNVILLHAVCYFFYEISKYCFTNLNSLYRLPVIPPFALIIWNKVLNLSKASNFDIFFVYCEFLREQLKVGVFNDNFPG